MGRRGSSGASISADVALTAMQPAYLRQRHRGLKNPRAAPARENLYAPQTTLPENLVCPIARFGTPDALSTRRSVCAVTLSQVKTWKKPVT